MYFEPTRKVAERYVWSSTRGSSHSKILALVGKNKRVLDIGCATGYLGEALKKIGCEVIGIEIDEEAARIARTKIHDVIIADVESINHLPYPDGYFNVHIYGDILEHLKRPDLVLLRFRKYLSNDGRVIASIPNVANWVIRLNLLRGRFQYSDIGILDKTHLRFFTVESIKQLFESAGYKIIALDYVLSPLPRNELCIG
jgi:2-polyprenyl-3-methyl-5-hydroxy-6-metoxy-1,4-benzoquinol methylase